MAVGDTNLTNLVLSGNLTVGNTLSIAGAGMVTVEETFALADFVDGEGAAATAEMAADIPVGAFVVCANCTAITGFIGDTSAVLTIGDGTDVDRYMTGTPSVFTTAANGIALGVPSGVQYHVAAKTPTLTVTADSEWGDVTAGSVTVSITYIQM